MLQAMLSTFFQRWHRLEKGRGAKGGLVIDFDMAPRALHEDPEPYPDRWAALAELRMLRAELEKYKPGMSARARMVVANKADLFDSADAAAVARAREKLATLERVVRELQKSGTVRPPFRSSRIRSF